MIHIRANGTNKTFSHAKYTWHFDRLHMYDVINVAISSQRKLQYFQNKLVGLLLSSSFS